MPHTTYHYRIVAQNSVFTADGDDAIFSTLDSPPNTPTNISPADTSINEPVSITLVGSSFSDPDIGDTEGASEWIIRRALDKQVVYDSGEDSIDRTTIAVPLELEHSTDYEWSVRYTDNVGEWSNYSSWTSFSTQQKAVTSFLPYVGAYAGILQSISSALDFNGVFSLALGRSGVFTAVIHFGGHVYNFRGMFQTDGVYVGSISPPGLPALNVVLTLDTMDSSGIITGTVSDGNTTNVLEAGHSVYKAGLAVKEAGKYNVLLSATEQNANIPLGSGYATVKVTSRGGVSVVGALADGRKFSNATILVTGTGSSWFALYSPLIYPAPKVRGSTGTLIGTIVFGGASDGGALGGELHWSKPVQTAGLYPLSIDTELDVIGSRYNPPVRGATVLPGFTTGTLKLTDMAALSLSGTAHVEQGATINASNQLILRSPIQDQLKVKISISTGVFAGTFVYPGERKPVSFSGMLLQQDIRGGGFFLGPNGSGSVSLDP